VSDGAPQEFDPYRAPQAPLASRQRSRGRRDLAGRGERLLAAAIDAFAYAPALFGFAMGDALGFVADPDQLEIDTVGLIGISLSALWCVAIFAVQIYLLSTNAWTIGKRLLRIRIVHVDGGDASLFKLIVLRTLLPWLMACCCNLINLIDVLMILGDERRCLHDFIASTIVVKA
jgi:uncharacterized RDD family membrane protein YckC